MQNATRLPILTAAELMAAELPPRTDLLAPLLASDTAALVYGPSGIGKSFFALGIAWAVAGGGSFLGWQAPRSHRVLYVDGEMGAAELRDRFALFGPTPDRLSVYAHDLNTGPLLDLSEKAGLLRLMAAWNDPELVVLDAFSSLSGLASGDAEGWTRMQRFLLHQRQSRRAVLMVHHVNREGDLHGTSRREAGVDLMISLRRPDAGPLPAHARFEIHFDKVRGRRTPPLVPFLAELESDAAGRAHWRWGPPTAGQFERAVTLMNSGFTAEQVRDAVAMSRSAFFRAKARARAQGLLLDGARPR
jgi:hypothetical protein